MEGSGPHLSCDIDFRMLMSIDHQALAHLEWLDLAYCGPLGTLAVCPPRFPGRVRDEHRYGRLVESSLSKETGRDGAE